MQFVCCKEALHTYRSWFVTDIIATGAAMASCSLASQWARCLTLGPSTVATINSAADASSKARQWAASMALLRGAQHQGVEVDITTMNAVVSSMKIFDPPWARVIHLLASMEERLLKSDVVTLVEATGIFQDAGASAHVISFVEKVLDKYALPRVVEDKTPAGQRQAVSALELLSEHDRLGSLAIHLFERGVVSLHMQALKSFLSTQPKPPGQDTGVQSLEVYSLGAAKTQRALQEFQMCCLDDWLPAFRAAVRSKMTLDRYTDEAAARVMGCTCSNVFVTKDGRVLGQNLRAMGNVASPEMETR